MPDPTPTLYTIGFAGKSAAGFFGALRAAEVRLVIDVRLKNTSQMAGFTKRADLPFFLAELCGAGYEHRPEWAPPQELLGAWRAGELDWAEYERAFHGLLRERRVEEFARAERLDAACLLCSEAGPEHCHRRLVAEHLAEALDLHVIHL